MSGSSAQTDADLVEQAKSGSSVGSEQLYRKYRHLVFGLTYRYLHNREDALDATQETFIKCFRGLEGFRKGANFKTWLLRIAYNTAIDRLRARARRVKEASLEDMMPGEPVAPPGQLPEGTPLEKLEARELETEIGKAISQLGEKHRQVVILSALEQMTYQDIAETLGISPGTVMSRLYHARKKLRGLLSRKGYL